MIYRYQKNPPSCFELRSTTPTALRLGWTSILSEMMYCISKRNFKCAIMVQFLSGGIWYSISPLYSHANQLFFNEKKDLVKISCRFAAIVRPLIVWVNSYEGTAYSWNERGHARRRKVRVLTGSGRKVHVTSLSSESFVPVSPYQKTAGLSLLPRYCVYQNNWKPQTKEIPNPVDIWTGSREFFHFAFALPAFRELPDLFCWF